MKIWRVIDDGTCALVTSDELTALRLLRKLTEKYDVTVAWVDSEEVQ